MSLSAKQLGAEEYEVLHTRTHAKALILPALALIVIGGAVGAFSAMIPDSARPTGELAIVLLGLVLVVWWVLLPFLRWRTTTYTVTNHRLVTRSGILTKVGHDLPLGRINEVSYERSLSDRMFGCGTINVQTAAEDGAIAMTDVPDVEDVHREISELLFGNQASRSWPADRR